MKFAMSLVGIIVFCLIYFEWRNNWVFRLKESFRINYFDKYDRTPSYNSILYKHIFTWKTDIRYWMMVKEIEDLKAKLKSDYV